jgi:integrase
MLEPHLVLGAKDTLEQVLLCLWDGQKPCGVQRMDGRIAASDAPVGPWRLHDLRRTLATRLAELGTLPHVMEALLNHVSGHKAGVAGVYNRATYRDEKRKALNAWAEHLATANRQGAEP